MRHCAILLPLVLIAVLPLRLHAEEQPTPEGTVEEARRPLPKVEGDAFRFVVLADTHASVAHPEYGEAFAKLVAMAAELEPDLALFAGDMVDGHVSGAPELEKHWEVFDEIAARLPCPYRLVVGNNDVLDLPTANLWMTRYGAPTRTFDVANARFVLLNGELLRSRGRIDEKGLSVLRQAVEQAEEGEHLFVFTHRPWWRVPETHSNWVTHVHPLLEKHASAHVFAGHWHHYEQGKVRDGVRYTIASAAGGPVGKVEVGGEFHALLLVSVKGGDVTVEVMRDGKAHPADVVTEERCALLRRLEEAIDVEAVALTGETSREIQRTVGIENVLEEPLELTFTIELPEGCNWQAEAPSDALTLEPGGTLATPFHLALSGDALPLPRIHTLGRSGGDIVLDHKTAWAVHFDRRLEAVRAKNALAVDGVLDEAAWATAAPAGRFVSLMGDAYAKRKTTMRALWTPQHLYIALEFEEPALDQLVTKTTQRDWSALADDAVLLFFDVQGDGSSCYCLGATASGVPTEFSMTGGRPNLAWNESWEVATSKGEGTWTLELALPWSSVGYEPEGERTFGMGVWRHSVPGGRDLTGWTPPKGGMLSNPESFGKVVLRSASK